MSLKQSPNLELESNHILRFPFDSINFAMDHFPVSSLLDEVSLFQRQDFEAAWTLAQEESEESDIDSDLFTASPMPTHDLSFDLLDSSNIMEMGNVDPLLSAASLDYDSLLYGPCSPIMSESLPGFSLEEEIVKSNESLVKEEQEDDEVDYPTDIHSYAQQPEHEERTEQDVSNNTTEEEMEEDEENISPATKRSTKITRRRRQRRGNKRRTVSSDVDEEAAAIFSNGKPKLYTQRPFNNPDMERARLNALNAKMNRERKKQEADNLKRELERLRKENAELIKSSSRLNNRATRAEQELARIRQVLEQADLVNVLKWSSGK